MVPTDKEIHNYHFPGQSIQDLKVINQEMCEKAYHIYSLYDQLLTPHPPLQAVWSTNFNLNLN